MSGSTMRRRLLVWLAALALMAAMAAGLAVPRMWPASTDDMLRWTSHLVDAAGFWGPFALMAGQVLVAASGVLPASLLGLAAGALFGTIPGFALVSVSTLLGGMFAFRLSRSLFRSQVERLLARRRSLADLDGRIAAERWRLVCLLRVSPVMPFAATSYLLGLSSVRERDYFIGTLAALPALLGYVLLGRIARSGISAGFSGASSLQWTLLGVGALATVAATASIGRLVRQALRPRERVVLNDEPVYRSETSTPAGV